MRFSKLSLLCSLVMLLAFYIPTGHSATKQEVFASTLRAAQQGNPAAQADLGWRYSNGEGVHKDYHQAFIWYRKAAEQGNVYAQDSLGWMYINGLGTPKDDKQAAVWLRKAAQQGDADAQNYLGVLYEQGWGVNKDFTQALDWYRKAAKQGDTEAPKNLKALQAAIEASRSKSNSKQEIVDTKHGKWVYIDPWEGRFKNKTADKQQAAVPASRRTPRTDALGHIMLSMVFVAVLFALIGLFNFAKKSSHRLRTFVTGTDLCGRYTESQKAIMAAEQGDAHAQAALGWMYYQGATVPQDFKLAYVWLSVATANGFNKAQRWRDMASGKLSPDALEVAQAQAAKHFEIYKTK